MTKRKIWEAITFEPGACTPWAPVIYHWRFRRPTGEVHNYVGQAPNASQRTWDAYVDHAFKLLNGVPYRPDLPDGFHAVHYALAQAVREGWEVQVRLVENAPVADLDARLCHWASHLDCDLNP